MDCRGVWPGARLDLAGEMKNPMPARPTILLADDSEDDLFLIQRAIQQSRLLNPIQVVRDGEEAVEYLSGVGRFADRSKFPLPFLLLLDLHMPKQNGFDVLRWIRSRPDLKDLKVAVLTASGDESHYSRAMQLGADSYFTKPGSLDEFVQLMLRLRGHWLLVEGHLEPEVTASPHPREEAI
jgi:CheY-like chemotaxis protein